MMAQRFQLDMLTKGRTIGMLESSRSQTEVSQILNVDQSVISRLWQKFQRTGDATRQPVLGRPQESQPLAKTDFWRLNHAGLYARRPAVCIPFTSAHKRARLNWSLKHRHIGGSNGMGMHHDGRPHRPPFFDTGSVTAQRYRDEVLERYVHLFLGAVSPDFILMDDNAPCP
ncbi:transposable element Tcb2 transposase [Trichonephila clavipes]|nr:transposable element Tcb2 transposase [Trichonephila clavipes]